MKNLTSIFIVILSLLYIGCGKEDTEEITESSSELEPLVYTIYSDKTELFVDFKPLITGTETKFAAHFTHLGETFKAFTEGTVTVKLKVGDNEISETSSAPSSPGIFRLSLTPQMQGKGQLIFDITSENSFDQIIIDDITVYEDEGSAFFDQKEGSVEEDLTYLKEQAWKIDFANEEVIRKPFNEVIKASGQLSASPGDESMIVSKSQGIVSMSRGNATIGAMVGSGELLFSIKGSDVIEKNIDVRFAEIQLMYDKALADYERGKELVKDKIISQKEFLERENALQNAEIIYNNISENYSGDGENVYSPISGYVNRLFVNEGQFVSAGQPLGSVTKNRKLLLTAEVSQEYYSRLGSVRTANFKTEYDNKVYNTSDLNGTLVSYGRTTGNNNFYVPVNFEIENNGNLLSGSFVQVYLFSDVIREALVVPVSSLIEEQGMFYVYVQTGGESFQKREVKIGAGDGRNVEVLSGIESGERVVTKGAYNIKLATMSGTIPDHGHEH
jgi:cobalt-zinc-cadmium efflux system membrane fusion protein